MDYKFLGNDITPEKLKSMTPDERSVLCSELRDKILNTVSSNGGHLASNLGAVEYIRISSLQEDSTGSIP